MADSASRLDLRRFAPEIRLRIFKHVVALEPNKACPPILIALGKDPELYAEAQEAYRKANYVITSKNQEAFKKRNYSEMMKTLHLRMVFDAKYCIKVEDKWMDPITFKSNKMIMWNNLETITVDSRNASTGIGFCLSSLLKADLAWLVRASVPGISKILAVLEKKHPTGEIFGDIKVTGNPFGTPTKVYDNGEYGDKIKVLVWEARKGGRLLSAPM